MNLASATAQRTSPAKQYTFTVWTDTNREKGFKLYEQTHPNVKLNLEVVGSNGEIGGQTIEEKIALDNKAGSGWPDVTWLGSLQDYAQLQLPALNYPANISSLVSKSTLKNWTGMNICHQQGKLICLRNDIEPDVLWYNADLMQQWGYQVPTTWAQYEQLGEEVATQHPGYIVGDIYGEFGLESYFWAAGCDYQQITGKLAVKVNMTSSNCKKMANILDTLNKDHVLSTLNDSDPSMTGVMQKALMVYEGDWWGTDLFEKTYDLSKGTWEAAQAPAWTANGVHWTGDMGGGVYTFSKHMSSSRLAQAVKMVLWMTTNTSTQGFEANTVTYPAYKPAGKVWLNQGGAGSIGYFKVDPGPVFDQAENHIRPNIGYVAYDAYGTFANTMTQTAASGKSMAAELPAWQHQATQLLQAAGYNVSH